MKQTLEDNFEPKTNKNVVRKKKSKFAKNKKKLTVIYQFAAMMSWVLSP